MNTEEAIKQYQKEKSDAKLQFKFTEDGDAIILNHRYAGMKISDIAVVNMDFINWLIGDPKIDHTLKTIARSIKDDYEMFSSSINREVIHGK